MPENYITREGYAKLYKDLEKLQKLKKELSKEIGEAMEQGDLRENAGYTAAKERQAETLRRIGEMEEKLRGARLIDELKLPKNEIRIGAKVTLMDKDSGREVVYVLVGTDDSDPSQGKISVQSPLAQGLLGVKVGQEAKVSLPSGIRIFKVLKVE